MKSFYPWLILLAPLASATFITLFTLRWKSLSSAISVTAVLITFGCSCFVFAHSAASAPEFLWLDVPPVFRVPLGLTIDQLSRTMAVLVSGVGALIHIY
jgi:NADH:ubiquinone oxidoreductase subunit 5 (subunit L)/multisubunit Na+/H+ antiporter MnhA subunit